MVRYGCLCLDMGLEVRLVAEGYDEILLGRLWQCLDMTGYEGDFWLSRATEDALLSSYADMYCYAGYDVSRTRQNTTL